MNLNEYLINMFSFNGPILSMIQASLGMIIAIIVTKRISLLLKRGSSYKINISMLIIVSIIIGIVTVPMGAIGLLIGLPPYIYYPIPLLISLLIPKYIFKLNWIEFCLYIVIGTFTGFLTHIIFSLLLGYNNYLPFLKILPIWK